MPEHDDLLHDLRELGRSVPTPGAAGIDTAILARLAAEPEAPSRAPRTWPRVAAVGLATLLALLLVPPVRAAVSDWFGFGSVVVRQGEGSGAPPSTSPTPSGPGMSPRQAAARVPFTASELPALGEPERAWVSRGRRVLTLTWADGTRLDQSSSLTYTIAKAAPSFDVVSVRGGDALWFADAHEVAVLDADGREVVESRRRVGSTLVWQIGGTTLRLEGEMSLTRAVAVAESARRLD